jgi:hypothetical protein
MVNSCEYGKEICGFTKRGEFLRQLVDYQLLKRQKRYILWNLSFHDVTQVFSLQFKRRKQFPNGIITLFYL